ncbi:MAG: flagellar motor switch phosphatase FliY [Spirochaetia bacterium]|jgi:flagellar motor switch protein FliN/FliY|nr:flagellar motor switch phosphatase FliY [Spirochaetia bacterium]
MSDGSLSQDEIDALLQGSSMDFDEAPAVDESGLSAKAKMDFTSFLNNTVSSKEANLGGMVGESLSLKAPSIEVIKSSELAVGFEGSLVEIKMDYSEGLKGSHSYIFNESFASVMAGKMMGQSEVELNEAALSALEEAANTIAGSSSTSIGELLGVTVMNSPGQTAVMSGSELTFASDFILKATFPVEIEGSEPSNLVELFDISVVREIASHIGSSEPDPLASLGMPGGSDTMGMPSQGGGQMDMGQMGTGQMGGQGFNQANVSSVQFPNLTPQLSAGEQGNIGLLMDVYMEMTVELGRTKRVIKDILGMGEGTIIELDKLAGEPVDILVNHKLIAKGEVVVIDENFGVRVTEIISPMDRVSEIT